MPFTTFQHCEIFDYWRINFMGPYPSSFGNKYVLIANKYVFKGLRLKTLSTNNAKVVVKFLKKLFNYFGIPKVIISDRGTHFYNRQMEKVLKSLGLLIR